MRGRADEQRDGQAVKAYLAKGLVMACRSLEAAREGARGCRQRAGGSASLSARRRGPGCFLRTKEAMISSLPAFHTELNETLPSKGLQS